MAAVYPVIVCGGSGTRLWPASQPGRPKQFLALTGAESLFQATARRVAPLAEDGRLVVVAGRAHEAAVKAQLAEVGVSAVLLLEPEPRGSAPAMAAACAWIAAHDPDAVAVIVAADHHIPEARDFRAAARVAAAAAAEQGLIVTLGVTPAGPSTAYGYIAPGEPAGAVRHVAAFVEKPDAETAETYIAGGYLWNSGNFIVAARVLLEELETYRPAVAKAAGCAIAEAGGGDVLQLGDRFLAAPNTSIDYAVMEATRRAAVLPVDFAWSDVGAWDAVWEANDRDSNGNALLGEAILIEARDCLVSARPGLDVALVGVENLAVVADGGQVLVCGMAASQNVRHAAAAAGEAQAGPRTDQRFGSLAEARGWFARWLNTSALPLWWSLGADHAQGGYYEALTLDGLALEAPRRARVQARQAYVYASAGLLGWSGPWRPAARHGMDFFREHYRRPDGLYRTLVAAGGQALNETPYLYDQAFALLAMATLHQADPADGELEVEAVALRKALAALRHSAGGFREAGAQPFQANAHMHLLEAAIAWEAAGGDDGWRALQDEIVSLALERFVDGDSGALLEFFGPDWAPAAGDDGRLIEPGHQFEWASLLSTYGGRAGHVGARTAALRLFEIGVAGLEPHRGVAMNALWPDLRVRDADARFWPQTEYLKAALTVEGGRGHALAAADAIRLYLATPVPGVWRDKLRADGTFVDEPAPATSLYHLMAVCQELFGDEVRLSAVAT